MMFWSLNPNELHDRAQDIIRFKSQLYTGPGEEITSLEQ